MNDSEYPESNPDFAYGLDNTVEDSKRVSSS